MSPDSFVTHVPVRSPHLFSDTMRMFRMCVSIDRFSVVVGRVAYPAWKHGFRLAMMWVVKPRDGSGDRPDRVHAAVAAPRLVAAAGASCQRDPHPPRSGLDQRDRVVPGSSTSRPAPNSWGVSIFG